MKGSELKTEMDSRFAAVDERFEQVNGTLQELRLLIKSESEATRRGTWRSTAQWRPPNNWSA